MAFIHNIVGQRAQTEPERLYAEYPISAVSYEDGYRKTSYTNSKDNGVESITGDLNHDNVSRYIKKSILSVTGWNTLDDKKDFFTLGMDSSHSLMIVRRIKQGLAVPNIAPSTIYANPSVCALTNAILRLLEEKDLSANAQK